MWSVEILIDIGKGFFFWFVQFKVNNRERVRFWLDPWCNKKPLTMIFLSWGWCRAR